MPKQNVRVVIPRNPDELLALGLKIYAKHQEDGTKSPLNTLQDYNWNETGPNLKLADEQHKKAEDLKKEMEKAYKERDNYLAGIDDVIRASKNLLLPVYAKNPKKLGDYGFEVNDTPSSKKDDGSKPA